MFAFEWNPATDEVQRSADSAAIYGVNGNATREKGKNTVQRIHPDDREAIVDTVKTLTPTEDSYKAEYRVFHSSGKIVRVQQSARALFDSAGRMVRLIGITADITERKQAEEALRDLLANGQQRNSLPQMQTRTELYDLLGYTGYEARDREYFE